MENLDNMAIFMTSYLITDFLYLYFFDRVLGKKHSMKIMVLATFIVWFSDCTLKLFPQFIFGLDLSGVSSVLMILTAFIYAVTCFYGTFKRKMLAVLLYMLIQMVMDFTGLQMTILITGSNDIYNTSFLKVGIICSCSLITLGTAIGAWAWTRFENRRWKVERYQWLCLIFPFSQCIVLSYTGLQNLGNDSAISWMIISGVMLGFIADIYMFWLFERINKRKLAEEEMRKLQQQYEIEKMKFEQLKKMQEETAKMRHEIQNYLLTIKNMG